MVAFEKLWLNIRIEMDRELNFPLFSYGYWKCCVLISSINIEVSQL